MKMKKKENIVIIVILVVMLIAIIGVSYAAFNFSQAGSVPNKITTGYITMSYTESDNTINLGNALPTTDNTGVRRLKDGEYFDFEVTTDIKGNSYVNYEISAKEVGEGTIDGSNIKLYLSIVNEDGTETSATKGVKVYSSSVVGTVPTYKEEVMANSITGRPAGEMSLLTGTASSQGEVTTKYRLRMYVAEEYNPQGDGGGLSFAVKVNVYGKNEAMIGPVLKSYNANLAQTDFHADEYKKNITSIVTKDNTTIPEGVIESWDMSVADDGSVVAYIEDDGTGSGTYKLTIGGNGKIIANPNMSVYFSSFSNLKTIDLSYLDTSIVNNMSYMFAGCSNLTELDVSNFDTSNVIDMSQIFIYCSSLTELDLSNFDTSNVIDMSYMFSNCSSLTSLNLSSFNTSKVTNMISMFSKTTNLREVLADKTKWIINNNTDIRYMFRNSGVSSVTYI